MKSKADPYTVYKFLDGASEPGMDICQEAIKAVIQREINDIPTEIIDDIDRNDKMEWLLIQNWSHIQSAPARSWNTELQFGKQLKEDLKPFTRHVNVFKKMSFEEVFDSVCRENKDGSFKPIDEQTFFRLPKMQYLSVFGHVLLDVTGITKNLTLQNRLKYQGVEQELSWPLGFMLKKINDDDEKRINEGMRQYRSPHENKENSEINIKY